MNAPQKKIFIIPESIYIRSDVLTNDDNILRLIKDKYQKSPKKIISALWRDGTLNNRRLIKVMRTRRMFGLPEIPKCKRKLDYMSSIPGRTRLCRGISTC